MRPTPWTSAGILAGETLESEVALSRRMLQLIVDRAPQGTLYGQL